jgi:hypothetical protein
MATDTRYTAIRKRCDKIPTRPYLMDILIDGLPHWFANTAFLKEDYPASYHPLINQQEHLGWHHILLGRFSTLWCGLQNSHLHHSPSTDGKHSGTSWILSMILTIWREVQLHWEVRNMVKDGDTEATRLTQNSLKSYAKLKPSTNSSLQHCHGTRESSIPPSISTKP